MVLIARRIAASLLSLLLVLSLGEENLFSQTSKDSSSATLSVSSSPSSQDASIRPDPQSVKSDRQAAPSESSAGKIDPQAERKQAEEQKAREAARKRGEITFDDLKFEIERDGTFESKMLSEPIMELNKKQIRIRGYILPTSVFQQKGIKQFVLVRDNQECCFGPGAMIYDCVMIEVDDKKGVEFTTRPISVRGKFEIDTESFKYPDGKNYAIYKLKATEAK